MGWLSRLARFEGVALTVETRTGTLTEDPVAAVELCRSVPGQGIALDPSHYLVGPYHSQQFRSGVFVNVKRLFVALI